ncbi:hypothetical protein GQR58_015608 [Nymphon striatum]|nr:hypothetical protein GQR58_015608 [Nymphon striatum]
MVKKRQFSSSDEMDPEDINLETFRVVNELKVNQKHMQDDIDKLKLALVMTWRISSAVLITFLTGSPTSFIKYKEDSNIYRTKSSNSKLQYRLMLFHQYFKNVPGYLSTAGTAYRSTSATAEKRIEKENDTLEAAIKNMWNGDGVTTLSALIDKLKTDETVPSGHTLHLESNGETLAILFIKILNGIPVIIASITLDTQFQVCVRSQDKVVNVKKYIHLLTVESRYN